MNNSIWAQHIITAVRELNGVITYLKVCNHTGTQLVNETILSKADVIKLLNSKNSVITAYRSSHLNSFLQGAKVIVYQDNHGKDQLRTISNHSSPDNLDNLPKF